MQVTEYDIRQLNMMRYFLSEFSLGNINLPKLINNLEALLYCLESVDDSWKTEFHENWFVLEQVYAVSCFNKDVVASSDQDILMSISNLNCLIGNVLDRCGDAGGDNHSDYA